MVEFQWRRFRLFATVIALGIIAALAAAGGAARTSSGPAGIASATQSATITAKAVYFEPYDLTLKAGVPVVLEFVNDGAARHDVTIEGINVIDSLVDAGSGGSQAQSSVSTLPPGTVRLVADKGQSVRVTFIPRAGKFDFYCSDAGHRGAGMRGTIVVD